MRLRCSILEGNVSIDIRKYNLSFMPHIFDDIKKMIVIYENVIFDIIK